MTTKIAQAASAVRKMIDCACARNTPAELHYAGKSDETHIARIRLIKIENDEIYADAPLSADSKVTLSRRQPVNVHAQINGTRYAFATHVERVFTTVDLNAHKRISAITLALPERMTEQQRRKYFRMSVAGHEDIRVDFCAALADQPNCCSIDAERFSGRMVNVSAGGLLVIIPISQRRKYVQCERLFVEFHLPEIENAFQLSAEVRHFRRVHDGTDTLVGFRFEHDVPIPVERLIQMITRFVADQERRRLKRGRKS